MMEPITQLFSQKTVHEVLDYEHKTRSEIELKKEELRQMVGERYRDLIEAADTIDEMKKCSLNVKASLKDLKEFCTAKSIGKTKHISSIKKQASSKNSSRYMEIAAQAKVLMEMPEKIWACVERGHMINAAFLYLQSLQVLKNLSLDGTTSYSPVLLWFPMLGQQAQAVGNLHAAILKECHVQIRDHFLHTKRLAEALCSIIILEKKSIAEALQVLLQARLSVLKETLGLETHTKLMNVGTKARICDGVSIFRQTVLQIFDLFCGPNHGLVLNLLTKCSQESDQFCSFFSKGDSSKTWAKHLPKAVASFSIGESQEAIIAIDNLQSLCMTWFAESEAEMTRGIQELLKFTTSAKDLSHIRSALLEVLELADEKTKDLPEDLTNPDEVASSKEDPWLTACSIVFNRDIFLWKDVLSKLFLEKIKQLIEETFDKLLECSKTVFSLAPVEDLKFEMGSYVWLEHDSDIIPNMAWNQWQTRKQGKLSSQGGLSLKAAAVTPKIRSVCEKINEIMSQLLSDLNYCAPGLAEQQLKPLIFVAGVQPKPSVTDQSENKAITEHLKTSCYQFLEELLGHINTQENDISKSPSQEDISLDSVLHLSLLCRNFFDLCHSFQQCCCPKENATQATLHRQFSGKARLERLNSVDSAWNEMVDSMIERSHSLMTVWCRAVLTDVIKPYKATLLSSAANGNLISSAAVWDAITVEEENESGEKVTSQIKIPAAASAYTEQFLYSLCSHLNRVGGHSASRYTLRQLSQQALTGVYGAFSNARKTLSVGDANLHGQSHVTGTPSQTWALQCLFDLRYVHSLLYQPTLEIDDDKDGVADTDDDASYTYTELIDWLEGYVDPFDLDVFSPHLTRNIQRYVARTCVMLGMLSSPEKLSASATQKFVTTSKDSHNVLPLAADCGRFSYLPVSGRNTNTKSSQRISRSLSRQLPLASALRDLTRDSVEANEKQQSRLTSSLYSKLGALSSSWLSMASQAEE